jgi:hypothetical protein
MGILSKAEDSTRDAGRADGHSQQSWALYPRRGSSVCPSSGWASSAKLRTSPSSSALLRILPATRVEGMSIQRMDILSRAEDYYEFLSIYIIINSYSFVLSSAEDSTRHAGRTHAHPADGHPQQSWGMYPRRGYRMPNPTQPSCSYKVTTCAQRSWARNE